MELNLRPELQQALDDAGIDTTALNEVQLIRSIHAAIRSATLSGSTTGGLHEVLNVLRTGRESSHAAPPAVLVQRMKRAVRTHNTAVLERLAGVKS
jgi:hypothetical protein